LGRIILFFLGVILQSVSFATTSNEHAKSGQLLVFVSFSMSKISLQQWATQCQKVGGTLVLRGFKNNSLKETLSAANVIFKDRVEGMIVDPTAFERYAIKTVPAVLVTDQNLVPCNETNCPISRFDVIYGDIGLKYALEKIKNDGELDKNAQIYLERLNA